MSLISRIRTLARVRPVPEPELPEVAETVAIIMDGNGRWARRRGLPTVVGHRAGTRALRRTVEAAIELGIRHIVVYAFSTENWSRPQDEVDALMEIFAETIERELPDLAEQGVRVRFIGRRDRAPEELRRRMEAMEDRTELNTRLGLWIAFDYGGRAELVEATRRIAESGLDPREIDENVLAANLYAPELPDPDLLIRTSGELRVSNFMLWQLAYAELVFVDRLWPDFDERDLRAERRELKANNVRLRVMGRIGDLPEAVREVIDETCDYLAGSSGLLLNLALSYSGRVELIDAARALLREQARRPRPEELDEAGLARHLYTAGLPDPDLLIRTSGEMRLSNFMLWQLAYTELWITETLWPDFRRRHLYAAVADYQRRERRFGRVD